MFLSFSPGKILTRGEDFPPFPPSLRKNIRNPNSSTFFLFYGEFHGIGLFSLAWHLRSQVRCWPRFSEEWGPQELSLKDRSGCSAFLLSRHCPKESEATAHLWGRSFADAFGCFSEFCLPLHICKSVLLENPGLTAIFVENAPSRYR